MTVVKTQFNEFEARNTLIKNEAISFDFLKIIGSYLMSPR